MKAYYYPAIAFGLVAFSLGVCWQGAALFGGILFLYARHSYLEEERECKKLLKEVRAIRSSSLTSAH